MEELYHAALEKSGEEREALLAKSDPEVRRGVEALLAQGTSGEKLLDRPAWEQAGTTLPVPTARGFCLSAVKNSTENCIPSCCLVLR
jgi:hypothetical protein